MSDKDERYMHEINRLEGERDYWRNMHAKVDSECAPLRAALEERTVQHRVQHENALRLLFAIESAMQQAESEGHHKFRGTDTPKPFYETLSNATQPGLCCEMEAEAGGENPDYDSSPEAEIRRLLASRNRARRERDEARRAARHLYDLWPVERWATLSGVAKRFPWLDDHGDA